jgi:hypothetical protein
LTPSICVSDITVPIIRKIHGGYSGIKAIYQ